MLKLKNIKKNYFAGDNAIPALKGVSLEFRKSEFVSILGQSGCGKTTLLNIIGGLDKYTSGDLIINDKSTKDFTDADWDTYRNHSIGFVFQSYNLIPHQTVLANVELALTLSGVSADERKRRAIDVLEKVGLKDQIHKKPNQMSGGQMQRVAIARALVNDPDILLADEPTGALDSETSVQIMEILKEISKEKLIIMVTHNPELAEEYSNRIIRLLDGEVIDDTNPYSEKNDFTVVDEYILPCPSLNTDVKIKKRRKNKKAKRIDTKKKKSMSFFTALKLSLTNLMTKKGRTLLTSFAGSIGIIGIALILSVSTGVNAYIRSIEESTMASYPIQINETTMDANALLSSFAGAEKDTSSQDPNKIYSNNIMTGVIEGVSSGITTNNLSLFRKYLMESDLKDYTVDIKYNYAANLNTYYFETDSNGNVIKYKKTLEGLGELMQEIGVGGAASMLSMLGGAPFKPLVGDNDYVSSQYDIVYGALPENPNEVVLIVNSDKQISDFILYSLGIRDTKEITTYFEKVAEAQAKGEKYTGTIPQTSYTFEEICGYKFKILLDSDYYELQKGDSELGIPDKIVDMTNDKEYMDKAVQNAKELEIVGIICPKEGSVTTVSVGSIGYTSALMDSLIEQVNESDVVKAQYENKETNLFTGYAFAGYTVEWAPFFREQLKNDPTISNYLPFLSDEQLIDMINDKAGSWKSNLATLGYVDFEKPTSILIYPKDFDAKDVITDKINEYNDNAIEKNKITYTDTVAMLMSSVTTIVNAISYVLIAFVAISLIVSSIMIGIITYISVLERTKEIGILRAVGASKKDVSRVFNAETLIVGFAAGAIGIILTLLFNGIINVILHKVTGILTLNAILPFGAAVILVLISMGLTLIAGLVPSRVAAKKDPVIALRTE